MSQFTVVPGKPEMEAEISRLQVEFAAGTLSKDERRLAKKVFKAIANLSRDPFYPALQSHEIAKLTERFSKPGGRPGETVKVFQSYLENDTPSAGRIYWVYGPEQKMITLVGFEPHPEDRKDAGYSRVQLSRMPTTNELAEERAKKTAEASTRKPESSKRKKRKS